MNTPSTRGTVFFCAPTCAQATGPVSLSPLPPPSRAERPAPRRGAQTLRPPTRTGCPAPKRSFCRTIGGEEYRDLGQRECTTYDRTNQSILFYKKVTGLGSTDGNAHRERRSSWVGKLSLVIETSILVCRRSTSAWVAPSGAIAATGHLFISTTTLYEYFECVGPSPCCGWLV